MEEKKRPGQPKKFQTVEEMQKKIDEYFESCYSMQFLRDMKGNLLLDLEGQPIQEKIQTEPFTITGLALALGTNRQTLLNYQNVYGEEFFDSITHAKTKIENYAEKQLYLAKSANGPAFNLKNNYGWVDKQEIDQRVSGDIQVSFTNPDLDDYTK